jgi:hypothetical protein
MNAENVRINKQMGDLGLQMEQLQEANHHLEEKVKASEEGAQVINMALESTM